MTSIPAANESPMHPSAVAECVEVLRLALEARAGTPPVIDGLRPIIDALGASARASNTPPEHLLVLVKDMLRTIPRPKSVSDELLRERVITSLISAYYTPPEQGK
jgi:hypothetical protein